MRPLTERTPKPLLPVGGKPLIAWHLEKLAHAGIEEVVINTSWLAEQFPATLGDGGRWGLRLNYLHEGTTPLETGGGMLNALSVLGDDPFLLVNGDIWTDHDFSRLPRDPVGLAHLVMVDRPPQAKHGDFALDATGQIHADGAHRMTYAGLGVYRPALLEDWQATIGTHDSPGGKPRFPLAPILKQHMPAGRIHGEYHGGRWTDVGTPQRLRELDAALSRT